MEVMVTHPLVLPDAPLDLPALEEAVRARGREGQQRAMAAAWERQAALRPLPPCPACGRGAPRSAGTKPRRIETTLGPVHLPRRRMRCRACGRHFQPDAAVLAAAVGGGQRTPGLRNLAALCGASWPYRQAAQVLGALRGRPPAVETVRTVVAQTGAAVAARQAQEGAAACAPSARVPAERAAPARLEVALGGGWVRSHDNAQGMEVKVGVGHTGSERIGRTRTRLRQRRYAATPAGVARVGPLVAAAVDRLGGYGAAEQTLLGDGAEWTWRVGEAVLAEATPVLDRWHLRDARRRALRRAVPDEEERAGWADRTEARLDSGEVAGAQAVLAEVAAAPPHPALDEFAAYVAAQAARIPDDAQRRRANRTIGSGAVEKGGDVVVNRRLKGRRGMKWWRERAAGVVALRVAQPNGEWDRLLAPASLPPDAL